MKKLDLLESRIRALLEERDRLRARVKEVEKVSRDKPQGESSRMDHHKLLKEREAIRQKAESLLRTLRGFKLEG